MRVPAAKSEPLLLAAVEHDHERNGFAGVAGRDIEVVAARPGGLGVAAVTALTAGAGAGGRRCATDEPPGRLRRTR